MNSMSSGELIHGHRSGNRNRCHAGWLKGRFQPYWYQLTVDNERVSKVTVSPILGLLEDYLVNWYLLVRGSLTR